MPASGCGRPYDHQRLSSSLWRCLSLRSSTQWWVSLLHRDRFAVQTVQKPVKIAQVQFLDWDTPVVVRRSREVPQIQFIDSVEDTPVWQQRQVSRRFSPVEVPQIQFIDSVEDTPLW